jgi:hypothetical protein
MDLAGPTLPQKWLIHSAIAWRVVAGVSTAPVLFIGMCGKEGAAAPADRQRRLIFGRFEGRARRGSKRIILSDWPMQRLVGRRASRLTSQAARSQGVRFGPLNSLIDTDRAAGLAIVATYWRQMRLVHRASKLSLAQAG